MKKLLLIVVAVFSMTALFAQSPQVGNGSVERTESLDNVYFIDYTPFLKTKILNFGTGYVDVDPINNGFQSVFENEYYKIIAREKCSYFKLIMKEEFDANYSTYPVYFRVLNALGTPSNVGIISVKINWLANPQACYMEPCLPF